VEKVAVGCKFKVDFGKIGQVLLDGAKHVAEYGGVGTKPRDVVGHEDGDDVFVHGNPALGVGVQATQMDPARGNGDE